MFVQTECQRDPRFYSCSASKDYRALMTSLSFQTLVSSFLNQVWESLPHRFVVKMYLGFPSGASGTGPACQCRRHKRCRFNSWVRKIHWRRAWQLTPVFLIGKSLGQRSLVGYNPCGSKESDTTEVTQHTQLVEIRFVPMSGSWECSVTRICCYS